MNKDYERHMLSLRRVESLFLSLFHFLSLPFSLSFSLSLLISYSRTPPHLSLSLYIYIYIQIHTLNFALGVNYEKKFLQQHIYQGNHLMVPFMSHKTAKHTFSDLSDQNFFFTGKSGYFNPIDSLFDSGSLG